MSIKDELKGTRGLTQIDLSRITDIEARIGICHSQYLSTKGKPSIVHIYEKAAKKNGYYFAAITRCGIALKNPDWDHRRFTNLETVDCQKCGTKLDFDLVEIDRWLEINENRRIEKLKIRHNNAVQEAERNWSACWNQLEKLIWEAVDEYRDEIVQAPLGLIADAVRNGMGGKYVR